MTGYVRNVTCLKMSCISSSSSLHIRPTPLPGHYRSVLVMLCNKLARYVYPGNWSSPTAGGIYNHKTRQERKVLLDHVTSKFPSTALLDHWSMFQWLMLSEEADVNCRRAEFVYNGLPK